MKRKCPKTTNVREPQDQPSNLDHTPSLFPTSHLMPYVSIQMDPGLRFPDSSPNISQKQEQEGEQCRSPHSYFTRIGSYSSQDEINYFRMQTQQATSFLPPCF